MRQRLAGRAEQAGMELAVEGQEEAAASVVRVNVSAAEQVLFNLVDNACKYAAEAADRRIHLVLRSAHKARNSECATTAGVSPRCGGGCPALSKSAREAAHSAPGVGLGLP